LNNWKYYDVIDLNGLPDVKCGLLTSHDSLDFFIQMLCGCDWKEKLSVGSWAGEQMVSTAGHGRGKEFCTSYIVKCDQWNEHLGWSL